MVLKFSLATIIIQRVKNGFELKSTSFELKTFSTSPGDAASSTMAEKEDKEEYTGASVAISFHVTAGLVGPCSHRRTLHRHLHRRLPGHMYSSDSKKIMSKLMSRANMKVKYAALSWFTLLNRNARLYFFSHC